MKYQAIINLRTKTRTAVMTQWIESEFVPRLGDHLGFYDPKSEVGDPEDLFSECYQFTVIKVLHAIGRSGSLVFITPPDMVGYAGVDESIIDKLIDDFRTIGFSLSEVIPASMDPGRRMPLIFGEFEEDNDD